MTDNKQKPCPKCNGEGWYADHSSAHYSNPQDTNCSKYGCPIQVPCEECQGTGICLTKDTEVKND